MAIGVDNACVIMATPLNRIGIKSWPFPSTQPGLYLMKSPLTSVLQSTSHRGLSLWPLLLRHQDFFLISAPDGKQWRHNDIPPPFLQLSFLNLSILALDWYFLMFFFSFVSNCFCWCPDVFSFTLNAVRTCRALGGCQQPRKLYFFLRRSVQISGSSSAGSAVFWHLRGCGFNSWLCYWKK